MESEDKAEISVFGVLLAVGLFGFLIISNCYIVYVVSDEITPWLANLAHILTWVFLVGFAAVGAATIMYGKNQRVLRLIAKALLAFAKATVAVLLLIGVTLVGVWIWP